MRVGVVGIEGDFGVAVNLREPELSIIDGIFLRGDADPLASVLTLVPSDACAVPRVRFTMGEGKAKSFRIRFLNCDLVSAALAFNAFGVDRMCICSVALGVF